MPAALSNQASPSITTRPAFGRYSPAIVRRIVDLPLPDGPTSASTSPGAQASAAASGMGSSCARRAESPGAAPASAEASANLSREPIGHSHVVELIATSVESTLRDRSETWRFP